METRLTNLNSNPIFRNVHKSKCRYVLLKGSAGSGKSVDTAQEYILRLLEDKGRNLLCIRKSEVTNRDSTYAELLGAISRLKLSQLFRATINPLSITCKNGNKIIFRGVNSEKEREKLKSITFEYGNLTDVWIEEATEISQEDFEIIDDRLRGELPSGYYYQIKGTFNPVNINHWIKKAFFDREDKDVLTHHSTYLDNRFIGTDYARRMKRRQEIDPDGYKIYGLGEWGEVSGLILKNWEIKEFSNEASNFDSMVNAQDFGFNHANCIGEVGFKDGDLYLCREIYEYEKDTEELISLANLEGFNKSLRMWCDSAEPDRIKMWQKAGYRAKGVDKGGSNGSVRGQIDCLKQRKIYIHPSCVNTLKEIRQWKWRKDSRSNTYVDEPVPFMDDAMAMLRYSVEDIRKSKSQWLYK
ncbi:MAG: PBSX family phage terminase large subunit [Anaerovoracaceae bacterium]